MKLAMVAAFKEHRPNDLYQLLIAYDQLPGIIDTDHHRRRRSLRQSISSIINYKRRKIRAHLFEA
jgi:hypothetical protein